MALEVALGADIQDLLAGLNLASKALEDFAKKANTLVNVGINASTALGGINKKANEISQSSNKVKEFVQNAGENLRVVVSNASIANDGFVRISSSANIATNSISKVETITAKSAKSSLDLAKNTGNYLDKLSDSLTNIGGKLSLYLSVPLALLSKQALQNAGDLESLTLGLKSVEEQQFGVAKSAEYAISRLEEYKEVAKLPGLGLKEVVSASINLRSVGFSAGEAKKAILSFGNALALVGKGKAELSGVNTQLTQLAGKTSGFGADLRIIREYAPQVGGALQKAFGTIDTEKIAKTGVTGKEVIAKIIQELDKLPKAVGGLKNSFENLSDATFNSLADIGLQLNKIFDIQGKIEQFSEFVIKLADSFKTLSPFAQKSIGIIGGLAIVVPPLLISFGLMLPAITAIGTAIGAISAPVVAIGLAIGGLAYLIATNWDSIVDKLKDWGFIDQIKNTFNSWVGFLKAGFDDIKMFATALWSYFKDTLVPIWEGVFSTIILVVRSVFGVLEGLFKIFKGVLTLSWTDIWSGLGDILGNIFVGIFGTVAKFVGLIGVLVGKLFKTISGNDTLLKWATELSDSGLNYNKNQKENPLSPKKISIAPEGVTSPELPKELTEEQKRFIKKSNELFQKADILRQENYANSLKNELQKSVALEEAKYKEKINSVNKEVASEKSKQAMLQQLEIEHQNELKKIRDSYKSMDAITPKGVKLGGIGSTLANGLDAFGKVGAVDNNKGLIAGLVDKINAGIPSLLEAFSKVGYHVQTETEKLRQRTLNGFMKFNSSLTEPMIGVLMNLNERMGAILQQGAIDAFVGIGNIAGQLLTGSAGLSDAGDMILGVIGNIFSQMGQELISAGVIMSGLSALITNPLTSAGALIAVGVALSALGGALSSAVSGGGKGSSSGYGGSSGYSNNNSNTGYSGSQAMELTINLNGQFTQRGNSLVSAINQTQKQKLRTR